MTQIVINGIIAAAVFCLIGVGFSLVHKTARFFHFAHGAVFTGGAYFTFLFAAWLDLPLALSILFAALLSILFGCLLELSLYRPLRRREASPLIFLLASLGTYIVFQNVVSIIFGDAPKTVRLGLVKEGIAIIGARITPIQILTICTSAALVVTVAVLLKKSKFGIAMRALANDPELTEVCGVDIDQVFLGVHAIASGLAGIAGILVALDTDMTPTMGMNALMMGVVAVIIGGIGSIPGIAFGALLLAMTQQFGVWKFSSQWQDAIAFVILLAFLLLKPEGFMGKRVGKATV